MIFPEIKDEERRWWGRAYWPEIRFLLAVVGICLSTFFMGFITGIAW
jgi:hypothetical protein